MNAEKLIKKITKIVDEYFETKSLEDLSDEDLELWFNNFDVFRKYNYEYFYKIYWKDNSILNITMSILSIFFIMIVYFLSLISLGFLYKKALNFFDNVFSKIVNKYIDSNIKGLYKEIKDEYNCRNQRKMAKKEALEELNEKAKNKEVDVFIDDIVRLLKVIKDNNYSQLEEETNKLKDLANRYIQAKLELCTANELIIHNVHPEFWQEFINIEVNVKNKIKALEDAQINFDYLVTDANFNKELGPTLALTKNNKKQK